MRIALHWQILTTMLLGAVLGIALNAATGRQLEGQTTEHPAGNVQLPGMPQPIRIRAGEVWSLDSPGGFSLSFVAKFMTRQLRGDGNEDVTKTMTETETETMR